MSMDYISPLLQNKRGREGDQEEWDFQAKRVCNGLQSCVQVEYGTLTESPMDTWEAQQVIPLKDTISSNNHHHQVQVHAQVLEAQNGSASQCCPRCMAGEPGHINHIMQRY
ncbi:uncharacterized protein [Salminus brasiliensis]|uniref:uncharacterized protein n=1 Tax=Salminus brasiliensis TaxID=930266 RepID=UPI003B82F3AC